MKLATAFTVCAVLLAANAHASPILFTYTSEAAFLADTGATPATGPYPDLGSATPQPVTIGSITFSSPPPSSVVVGVAGHGIPDWTTLLAGNDIAVNDIEHLDILSSTPVFAMGFQFVEPSVGGSTTDTCFVASCIDSTFTVSLMNGATLVDMFVFNAPDDVAAFVGAWSPVAFDRMVIRETVGGIDDEFWGQVYTGNTPNPTATEVPEPASLLLIGAGLMGSAINRRSRSARLP
jgi:hypothetical protein